MDPAFVEGFHIPDLSAVSESNGDMNQPVGGVIDITLPDDSNRQ